MAEGAERKLAAIMFTDMVGYSALAQRNEALALDLLAEHQGRLRPIFPQHGGREIKTTGDGFLVEFTSALQAVRCAIAIQTALVERNASTVSDRRIQVRIGLHLGDVEVRDGDVFGDGVNIAARIEPLAEAGGICLTGAVFDQVRNKIDAPLVRLGQPELKNIQLPIDVYRVVLPWTQGAAKPGGGRPARRRLGAGAGVIAAAIGAVAALLVWWPTARVPHTPIAPPSDAVSPAAKKSVAVLPFVNVSSDKENEYFSDGITEDLITALSKVSGLHVAARTSSFAFKGKNEDIRSIGTQLNVGAVLEGSVAKAGNQVRITAQLAELHTAQTLERTALPEIESALGRAYADAGNRAEATKVLDHLRERMRDEFVSAAFVATLYIGLGEVDEAFAALAQAEAQHSFYVGWWKVDPELDPLRSDPRFAALLKKVGLEP